jgi:hypothetical protein
LFFDVSHSKKWRELDQVNYCNAQINALRGQLTKILIVSKHAKIGSKQWIN